MKQTYAQKFQTIFTGIIKLYEVDTVYDAKLCMTGDIVYAKFDLIDDEGNSVRKVHRFHKYGVKLLVDGKVNIIDIIDYV